jgi:hypothetical protein
LGIGCWSCCCSPSRRLCWPCSCHSRRRLYCPRCSGCSRRDSRCEGSWCCWCYSRYCCCTWRCRVGP